MRKKDTASFLLPSFLLQVVFPRIQILKNKKLLAMFTCVSQSGLKLFPKKDSVSKPFALQSFGKQTMLCSANSTLGILMYVKCISWLCVCGIHK